ncbi:hypothetical protein WN51_14690 [Melipona quadrifasciata]|uniref:Uncharacterized protein n=1 Tax=Melipona quadrifasciata TaxID=166423 RepID=A0A0N1ITL8_9HYME|nr:hypothetical protein WN51_14690 [Melipona quadrifasciata]
MVQGIKRFFETTNKARCVSLDIRVGGNSRSNFKLYIEAYRRLELFHEDTWSARSTSSPVRDRCEPAEISLERILRATERKKSQDRERRKELTKYPTSNTILNNRNTEWYLGDVEDDKFYLTATLGFSIAAIKRQFVLLLANKKAIKSQLVLQACYKFMID